MGESQCVKRFTFVASFYLTVEGGDCNKAFDEAVEWFRHNLDKVRVDEGDIDFVEEQTATG